MRFILFIVAVIFCCEATASPVQEYRLDNGLKILVQEDHRAPVVSFQIWYKVGGSYDHSGSTGISHIVEHMMFKGTQSYETGQFSSLLAENGATRNAATSLDYTYYYENIIASKLPLVFALEADRMHNLVFKEQEFAKELQIVMEERRFRTDNQPFNLFRERFRAISFLASPYHHPNVGWMSEIKGMTLQKVKNWYLTWYAPNNATLVIIGDVNPQQVYRYAMQYFAAIPAKPLPKASVFRDVSIIGQREISIRIPAKSPQLLLGYNVPVAATAKPAWETYALILLANILAGTPHAQLKRHLMHEQKLANHIRVFYDPFNYRMDHLFYIDATPAQGITLAQLKKALLTEVAQVQRHLISNEELAKVKARLIAHRLYEMDSLAKRAKQLGMLETVGLSWRTADEYEKNIQQVTPTQIQLVAQRYFGTNKMIAGMLIPQTK